MYLSRLILNQRSRQVQHELADPYEMHRTISRAFPNGIFCVDRQKNTDATGVLFRIDKNPHTGMLTLLVQSRQPPDWSFLNKPDKSYLLPITDLPLDLEENLSVKWVEICLNEEMMATYREESESKPIKQAVFVLSMNRVLAFRLRANPTCKKKREGKKQGKRVGLVHEEEQLQWLTRKIQDAGGKLLSAGIANAGHTNAKIFCERDVEKRIHFLSIQFDGILRVKDPTALKDAWLNGIGSGKGLGFGLLTLAPVS